MAEREGLDWPDRWFRVGRKYRTLGGGTVEILPHPPGSSVIEACIYASDGIWRYDRPGDRGRVTGAKPDDPRCLVQPASDELVDAVIYGSGVAEVYTELP